MSLGCIKKKYLCSSPLELMRLLAHGSEQIHNTLDFVYHHEKDTSWGVFAFCFASLEEAKACEVVIEEYLLADVSHDKRYSKRHLKAFGLPQGYDFTLETVYKRLDRLGIQPFHFAFSAAMSTSKVLRVLLYHALIHLEAYRKTTHSQMRYRTVKWICHLLEAWKCLYDTQTLSRIKERFGILKEMMQDEDPEVVDALLCTQAYEWMLLDIGCLLFEESDFYQRKKDIPLGWFLKKYRKKSSLAALRFLEKSLYM